MNVWLFKKAVGPEKKNNVGPMFISESRVLYYCRYEWKKCIPTQKCLIKNDKVQWFGSVEYNKKLKATPKLKIKSNLLPS